MLIFLCLNTGKIMDTVSAPLGILMIKMKIVFRVEFHLNEDNSFTLVGRMFPQPGRRLL